MNMQAHRFSLAWPRILPGGIGPVNPKGLDFYHRVIDRTLELGLEPWITLYHWDLPQVLEDKGGWTNRDVVGWFSAYVEVCARAFGDRVKHWMVLNEPTIFTALGYMQSLHAPGRKGFGNFLPAVHHAAMAQAEGGRVLRAHVKGAQIGTTFSASYIQPAGPTWLSRAAAASYNAVVNRLFLEPALGLGYPWKAAPFLLALKRYIRPGDMEKLAFDFDFIGLQTYFRQLVRFDPLALGTFAREIPHAERGGELTEMAGRSGQKTSTCCSSSLAPTKGSSASSSPRTGPPSPTPPRASGYTTPSACNSSRTTWPRSCGLSVRACR